MRSSGSLETLVVAPGGDPRRAERWTRLALPFVGFVVAANAAEAAARLADGAVDAVLVDAIAAPQDGADLLERLAPLARGRPLVVLVPPDAGAALAPFTALAGRVDFRVVADGGAVELCRALREIVGECRRAEQRRDRDRVEPVTGMPSREAFREMLQPRLEAATATSAMAVVDIDGLAAINGLLGRDVADHVLMLIAERLAGALREGDLTAAVGGGRFLVWTPLETAPEDGLVRTRRLLQAIARPFAIAGERLQLTASAGLALHPVDAAGLETLIARAEAAMYRAKVQGPGGYRLHQPLAVGSPPHELKKRAVVRRELEREGLELVFEPQLDLRTERPRAARLHLRTRTDDALLRLTGDEIDDLALPVIRWMLEAAGRQMASWLGHEVPLVPLVVDLPITLVRRSDVVEMIRRRLQGAGCHPAWFEVAIGGEPAGVDASDTAVADHLQALRDLGLRIALAGCGGPRSSLAALRHLPADSLELAGDLVQGQRERAGDATILEGLVGLGLGLGLDVGAAGVDRPGLARHLKELGCDWASGAWVGAPMPAQTFSDWLSGGGTLMIAAS
jgi:diguanylate cyclase (GGDEF)-like protein